MDPLEAAMQEMARRDAEYWAWRVEQACEAAIQLGTCGVRVRTIDGVPASVSVDTSVPYGQIQYQEDV